MVIDYLAWLVAAVAAVLIRFELRPPQEYVVAYVEVAAIAALVQLVAGYLIHAYRGRTRSGSFEDFLLTAILVSGSAAVALVVSFGFPFSPLPRTAVISTAFIALAIMLILRALVRIGRERSGTQSSRTKPVILFGAGDAGAQLSRSIHLDPASQWNIVALLDDDPGLQNRRLDGVRVYGTREDIDQVVKRTGAEVLVVSIARADSELLNDLSQRCVAAGIHMLVLPSVSELITSSVEESDIREVDEADLLGRTVVETDVQTIADMIHGRSVLITGAGGSIGSELARNIHPFGPRQLLLLDRDESALHAVRLSIYGTAMMDTRELVLADIRDVERLTEVFEEFKPEIVFHAAALKHLPMLETVPSEAVKTNIVGTYNVLKAAQSTGVQAFINISTDKAADPASVLGYSKRITERLTADFDQVSDGRYISVRFGNVLGSRGSMLQTFNGQIELGQNITVTHPDVSRFFMTIPEACQLVLQAALVGRGGEVLILDMGDPVKIVDVAKRLIASSGKKIDIVFTGLREGEKLHEDLVSADETPTRPFHDKVMHVPVEALNIEACDSLNLKDPDELRAELLKVCSSVEGQNILQEDEVSKW